MRADEAVAELMRESGDRLLRLAYQLCHDRAGAEDLVQEAVTRVYGSWLRRMPDVGSAEAYVRRAVVNEHLRVRRLRASTEVVTDAVRERADATFEGDIVERDRLWTALGVLAPRQRAVLVLRYYEDLADPDIARAVGCREATVRSLASRALAVLRSSDLIDEAP